MSDVHLRNLPVPFYSQRRNEYIWKKRYITKQEAEAAESQIGDIVPDGAHISMACNSCNITSVWMILKYYGVPVENPDVLMKRYFERSENDRVLLVDNPVGSTALESSYANLECFFTKLYSSYGFETNIYSAGKFTIELAQDEIKNGRPIIVSISMKKNNPIGNGHIIVIRGFTKINGVEHVIINDPWGSPVGDSQYLIGTNGASYWGGDIIIKHI